MTHKKILKALFLAALCLFVSVQAMPASAEVDSTVNDQIIGQARAIASAVQTRVQVYWSLWVDKQVPYTKDPLANPEPTWPSTTEISAAVGGQTVSGITFAESGMPADRKNSFYLKATVDGTMGGAAATKYVRNFLPMAQVSGNVVTVPVLRPAYAMGLQDLVDNSVHRDGKTTDGKPTFFDNAAVTLGDNASIKFGNNGVLDMNGGTIKNVKEYTGTNASLSGNVSVDNNLHAKNLTVTNNASVGNNLTVTNDVSAKTGTFSDSITTTRIIGKDGSTLYISGPSDSTMSQLIVKATTSTFNGNVGITGNLNVGGTITGTLNGNAATATRLKDGATIGLSGAATGTPTLFTGASDITIPITSLNAAYLSGRIPNANLSGTYGISITGSAGSAAVLSNKGSAASPLDLYVATANKAGDASTLGGYTADQLKASGAYLPLAGGTVTGSVNLSKETDIGATTAFNGALAIGNASGQHLEFDGNEIMAKASGTTASMLYLNNEGGGVQLGSSLYIHPDGTSWNEGLRMFRSSNGYSTIEMGVPANGANTGSADGAWAIAVNPSGQFTINANNTAVSSTALLNGSAIITAAGGTMTGKLTTASGTQLVLGPENSQYEGGQIEFGTPNGNSWSNMHMDYYAGNFRVWNDRWHFLNFNLDNGSFQSNGSEVITTANIGNYISSGTSFGGNGYYKFPNGLILEWGTGTTFPLAFPHACLAVSANTYTGGRWGGGGTYNGFYIHSWWNSGFAAYSNVEDIGGQSVSFVAIGY